MVQFGDFGNRNTITEPGAVFPVKLEIVADETPLVLVGPGGREVSAVGLVMDDGQVPHDAGPVPVVDAYRTMIEPRPPRAARSPEEAARAVGEAASASRIDASWRLRGQQCRGWAAQLGSLIGRRRSSQWWRRAGRRSRSAIDWGSRPRALTVTYRTLTPRWASRPGQRPCCCHAARPHLLGRAPDTGYGPAFLASTSDAPQSSGCRNPEAVMAVNPETRGAARPPQPAVGPHYLLWPGRASSARSSSPWRSWHRTRYGGTSSVR